LTKDNLTLGSLVKVAHVEIGAMIKGGLSCPEGFQANKHFDKRAPLQESLICTPKGTSEFEKIFFGSIANTIESLEINAAPKNFKCTVDGMRKFLDGCPVTKEPSEKDDYWIAFEFKLDNGIKYDARCEPKNSHLWIQVNSGFSALIKECTAPSCDSLDAVGGVIVELAGNEANFEKLTPPKRTVLLKKWIETDFKPRISKLKPQAAKMSELNQDIFNRFTAMALDLKIVESIYNRNLGK
jgi:hypothetical protein